MAEKPLARRLDDIEEKMDKVLETNEALINHFDGFKDDLSTVDTDLIKETIQQEILKAVLSSNSMPEDWKRLADYCIKEDISANTMMQFARVLSGDFRNEIGYEKP